VIELLKLCGFEAHEIESELPRVEKVLNRLGVTAEDVERGKQRLNIYYDMELEGVRKALGLLIKDVVNMVLAREEGKRKILYGFMTAGFEILGTALVSRSKDIYVANLAFSLQFVLGCIFDKITPILEAAEYKWLKAGKVSHCANVKTLVGLLALDLIPKPDLLVTSGQVCDTAPKTIDLIHELYDIPTYCYDTCQDREFREYPDAKRVIDLAVKSTKRLALEMQEIAGFEITDDMLWESFSAKRELQGTLMNLTNLLESSDPLPISATHEMLLRCMTAMPLSASELKEPTAVMNTIYEEVQNRASKGEGALEKGVPRILSLLPGHLTDPRWEHLPRELGIAVIASESGFFPMHGNRYLDTGEEEPRDPYELLARALQSSLFQSLSARIAIIIEVCKRLNVDGLLDKFHVGCRTTVGDALIVKDAITRELGIPVLLLEWEGFDPRVYHEEQYKRRLELFKEALNNSRQRKQEFSL
jgi:benzoyl-CoA reductase/2-hydroxyglutaryl-CoA dehydratase subunit BcrC/BadD/HgdB